MGTNDYCLILIALFFGYLMLAIRFEEKRTIEQRKIDSGPPGGIEKRAGTGRRRDSFNAYLIWAFRSGWKRLIGLFARKSG